MEKKKQNQNLRFHSFIRPREGSFGTTDVRLYLFYRSKLEFARHTELESTVATLPHLGVDSHDSVSLRQPLYRQILVFLPFNERPDSDGDFNAVRHYEQVSYVPAT